MGSSRSEGGTWRCLGAAFALYEMKIVLAMILHHHRLTLLDTGPVRHVLRNGPLGTERDPDAARRAARAAAANPQRIERGVRGLSEAHRAGGRRRRDPAALLPAPVDQRSRPRRTLLVVGRP